MPWTKGGNIRGPGATHALVRKTTDESLLNSITIQNDDQLFFAMAANEVWEFEFTLWVTGSTTGDLKLGLIWPSGATGRWRALGLGTGVTAEGVPAWTTLVAASGGTVALGTVSTTVPTHVIVKGHVVNGATTGNLQLQWGQNALDATNATNVRANSSLVAHKVA